MKGADKWAVGGQAVGRRDEDKKRRRKKRVDARDRKQRASGPDLSRELQAMERLMAVPQPATWPGTADASVGRPDRLKFVVATFGMKHEPGKSKLRDLERRLGDGLLGRMPELDHWAIEAFLYKGLPGDDWHPIDAYLAHPGHGLTPAAAAQVRLWKQAELGLHEVGPVADDLVALHEWDGRRRTGVVRRAISVGIGGVNSFRTQAGKVMLSYVAPWAPEAGISCAMGYGPMLPRSKAGALLPFLGLRYLEAAARTLPWKESNQAGREHLLAWRERDWERWLREVLTIPFDAFIPMPPDGIGSLERVVELMPSFQGDSRRFGVYFRTEDGVLAGATAVIPMDFSSANALALAEYHAYRKIVGPPQARPR